MTPVTLPPYCDTMVTLDHLFHRGDPRRLQPSRGKRRYVAACRRCNQRRARLFEIIQKGDGFTKGNVPFTFIEPNRGA